MRLTRGAIKKMVKTAKTVHKKLIFVVLDGIGDRLVKELENRTPLEAAHTPLLDKLAAEGATGILQVLPFAPESDEAVFTLLGYQLKDYTGRGPLEALGSGIAFSKGMLALRCNFATANGSKLIDRRVGRNLSSNEAKLLAHSIIKNVRFKQGSFEFKTTVGHRAVLILKSKKKLSGEISNTDPAYRVVKGKVPEALANFKMEVLRSRAFSPAAKASASLLNEFTEKSSKVLGNDPVNLKRQHEGNLKANVVLCRDAGSKLPDIKQINKLTGRNWAIIADMPLEIGIGKLTGMQVLEAPIVSTGRIGYKQVAELAVNSLKNYDSIYVHIKGPDVFGHDGDYEGKKHNIEDIDATFFGTLLSRLKHDTMIVVTGDHATPCPVKGHSDDPVPLLVWNSGVTDNVKRFNEVECSKGTLGMLKGSELMKKIVELAKGKV